MGRSAAHATCAQNLPQMYACSVPGLGGCETRKQEQPRGHWRAGLAALHRTRALGKSSRSPHCGVPTAEPRAETQQTHNVSEEFGRAASTGRDLRTESQ